MGRGGAWDRWGSSPKFFTWRTLSPRWGFGDTNTLAFYITIPSSCKKTEDVQNYYTLHWEPHLPFPRKSSNLLFRDSAQNLIFTPVKTKICHKSVSLPLILLLLYNLFYFDDVIVWLIQTWWVFCFPLNSPLKAISKACSHWNWARALWGVSVCTALEISGICHLIWSPSTECRFKVAGLWTKNSQAQRTATQTQQPKSMFQITGFAIAMAGFAFDFVCL